MATMVYAILLNYKTLTFCPKIISIHTTHCMVCTDIILGQNVKVL